MLTPSSLLSPGDALIVAFYVGFTVFTVWRDSENQQMLHQLCAAIIFNLISVETWTAGLVLSLILAALLGEGTAYLMTELSTAMGLDENEVSKTTRVTQRGEWRNRLVACRCLGAVFMCASIWTVRGVVEFMSSSGLLSVARQNVFAALVAFALCMALRASKSDPVPTELVRLRRLVLLCAPLLYCIMADAVGIRQIWEPLVAIAILVLSPMVPFISFADTRSTHRKLVAHWLVAYAVPLTIVWCTSFVLQERFEQTARAAHRTNSLSPPHALYEWTLFVLGCSALWILVLYTLYLSLMLQFK